MECPVCYETVAEEKRQILECMHFLCQSCLSKLRAPTCPLCRATITTYRVATVLEPLVLTVLPIVEPSVRRRRRRRRPPEERRTVPRELTADEYIEMAEAMIVSNPPVSPIQSVSDRARQKRRHARNRWRNRRGRRPRPRAEMI